MRVARHLFPKKSYRKRNSMFGSLSAFSLLKLMFRMTFYTISGLFSLGVLIVASLYKLFKRVKDYRHYKDIGMNSLSLQQDILKMDGFQFEIFCAELYKAMGHKAKRTQSTNDMGRDCIIDGNTFVECKHYTGDNCVGREICQKLIGSMEYFDIKKGIVFTTGKIHNNAFNYARGLKYKSLEFVNLNDIMKMLYSVNINKIPWIMSKAMEFKQKDLVDGIDSIGNKFDKMTEKLDEQY